MTHSIKYNRTRTRSPMWYFEKNYFSLHTMLEQTRLLDNGRVQFEVGRYPVELEVLEETRYTILVRICQKLTSTDSMLMDVMFTVRIYLDARLAEVITYQGQHRIGYKYPYPYDDLYLPGEKKQCNLFLYDWLNACSRLNYKESLIENC